MPEEIDHLDQQKADDLEHLIRLLGELGTPLLSDILGHARCSVLHDLGEDIVAATLARAVVMQEGYEVLKRPTVRLSLVEGADEEALRKVYTFEHLTDIVRQEISNFTWGSNQKSRAFLRSLGLSDKNISSSSDGSLDEPGQTSPRRPLYPYQNWIRKQLVEFLLFSPDRKRVVVHMPTGSGKTRTCMEALCDAIRINKKEGFTVVWMAHSEELCEQAVGAFQEIWGTRGSVEVNILRLWGGRSDLTLDENAITFVVTSFQTAYRMIVTPNNKRFELFSAIKRNNEILVVDEAHQSTATTYQTAIELFSSYDTKLIGLTATPGRGLVGDGTEATQMLAEFYNQNKIDIVDNHGRELINPIQFLQTEGILSSIEHKIWGGTTVEFTQAELRAIQASLDIPREALARIANDHQRTTRIIINTLEVAEKRGLPTILFAPTKENAEDIALILQLRGCSARAITSATSNYDRRTSIEQFKNGALRVLTNYGVLTTGFDAPNIRAVIIARPTTSVVLYSQMIGRGLRGPKMGGSPDCLIVDVKDNLVQLPSAQNAFTYFDEFYGETRND